MTQTSYLIYISSRQSNAPIGTGRVTYPLEEGLKSRAERRKKSLSLYIYCIIEMEPIKLARFTTVFVIYLFRKTNRRTIYTLFLYFFFVGSLCHAFAYLYCSTTKSNSSILIYLIGSDKCRKKGHKYTEKE